jgi:FKBP-type peptidyl-prolyl cis-trans isomerase SlyD
MNKQNTVVANDQVVSLAYELRLENGEVFDKSEDQAPLEFVQGRGQIIPGLENALYGMQIGEEKEVVISPEEGYGEYDEEDLDVVPRRSFPDHLELNQGMGLRLRDKKTGEVYIAYVSELDEEKAVLDYNHPLAGETLHFQVRVVDLREATNEELA